MTDETHLEGKELELYEADAAIDLVDDTLQTFLSTADVSAVYGEPIEKDDALIIPAAEVVAAMGFGIGSGYGKGSDESDEGEGGGAGAAAGGGGGGRVFSRPVAVVVASPEGVRVDPVIDFTKIALAGLTASAFMLGLFLRMLNPRKALEDLSEGKWG